MSPIEHFRRPYLDNFHRQAIMASPSPNPVDPSKPQHVSITPLLKRLWPDPSRTNVTATEIALAVSHIFTDQLSQVQTGALLTALHFTGLDQKAEVIARCAEVMRDAAMRVDHQTLADVVRRKGKRRGQYHGGLVS